MSTPAKSSDSRLPTHRLLGDALCREGGHWEAARRKCRKRPTPGRVHAVRVATRRLLASVAVAEIVGGADGRALRKSLGRVLKVTGKARDAQVQADHVERLFPRNAELGPFSRRLRKKARKAVLRAGPRLNRGKVESLLDRQLQALAKQSVEDDFERRLRRAVRTVMARVPRSRHVARPTAKSFHRGRLAIKEARYLAEILQPLFVPDRGRWVRDLRRRQRLTGEIHDLHNLKARIERYLKRKRPGQPSLKRVLRQLARQEQRTLLTCRAHQDVTPPPLRRG